MSAKVDTSASPAAASTSLPGRNFSADSRATPSAPGPGPPLVAPAAPVETRQRTTPRAVQAPVPSLAVPSLAIPSERGRRGGRGWGRDRVGVRGDALAVRSAPVAAPVAKREHDAKVGEGDGRLDEEVQGVDVGQDRAVGLLGVGFGGDADDDEERRVAKDARISSVALGARQMLRRKRRYGPTESAKSGEASAHHTEC